MKPSLLLIPFFSVMIGSIVIALEGSTDIRWLTPVGLATMTFGFVLWVILDRQNILDILGRKGARYGLSSGLALLLGGILLAGIAYLSTRPNFSKNWDLTQNQINTLSNQSVKAIEKINKDNTEIKIKAFFSEELPKSNFKNLINLYQSNGGNFKIQYLNTAVDFPEAKKEKITNQNTVIFRNDKHEARITVFNEEKVTNALLTVIKTEVKKVVFTKGHGEGDIESQGADGFLFVKNELTTNNLDVTQSSLIENPETLKSAALIVIAGPRYDFSSPEIEALTAFLGRGGALYVLVDALTELPRLSKFLLDYGIKINSDILLLNPRSQQAKIYGQNFALINSFADDHDITRDYADASNIAILTPMTRSVSTIDIDDKSIKTHEIAKTFSPLTIRIRDVKNSEDLKGNIEQRIDSDQHNIIAVASQQKADQNTGFRIAVVGSASLALNQGAQDAAKRDLFVNTANYLLQDEDFIAIRPKKADKSTLDLTSSSSQISLFFLSFIYPFMFLGAGGIYWLQRRRS